MSNLLRYTQQIFASLAGNNQLSEYGSFIASPPGNLYNGSTITPAIVQQLSNYLEGLYAATGGAYSPTIQDHNSLFYLLSYQIAYLLQKGIPEWDAGTTYFINDFVKVGEKIYISLQNTNLNNLVTDTAWWIYPDVYANSVISNTTIDAGTTITAGTGITATTGNITANTGQIRGQTLISEHGGPIAVYAPNNTDRVQFKTLNGSGIQSYNYPTSFPTISGQPLVSDTSGNMSWGNIQPLNTSSSLVTFPLSTWYSVAPGSILQTGKYLICGHAQFNITTSTPFTATLYVGIEGGGGVPSDLDEGINALTQSFGVPTGEAIISISLTNRFIIVNSPRVLYLYANVTASSSCTAGGNLIAIPWP